MNIYVNSNLEFHLQNDSISYIIKVLANGDLGHLYFGKKLNHKDNFSNMLQIFEHQVPYTPEQIDGVSGFALDSLKQEFPSFGTGDYKEPAYVILQKNGSRVTNFKFSNYEILECKPALKGLPHTYILEKESVKTLKITLTDECLNSDIVITYSIYRDFPIITRNSSIVNRGQEEFTLERFLSFSMDINKKNYELMHLSGAWARERNIVTSPINQNKITIDSKRGASSSNSNPFIALKELGADEFKGEYIGFNLVYSGNFIAQIEKDHYDHLRLNMGINPFNFSWVLEPNESFIAPEVVICSSDSGLNKMSQSYHNFYQNHLVRGEWQHKPRPILINNWEATYFDFDEEKILQIATKAKELGVELFVLDDGWFGLRDGDSSGLGDWWSNLEKLPNGVEGLSKKVEDLGLKFGLWFEPEMVNRDSELYREHPEWILSIPNRKSTLSRNQLTLDLGREDVRKYLFNKISKVLKESKISYIKWDMNRNMTEVWSSVLEGKRQGEAAHRYILGVYELMDKITTSFPHILFESCAGGGNRFDPGMLYYMPQIWTSDNTDAIERLKIQYGTSVIYPVSTMGAHVSAIPNHQTGRVTSINTRAHVAFFGAFGYELDLNKISLEEMEEVRKQILFFKENRELLQFGTFYRIESPFEGGFQNVAWIMVNKDKTEAILGVYRVLSIPNPCFDSILAAGLNPDFKYCIEDQDVLGKIFYGDELMSSGIKFRKIGLDIHNPNILEKLGDFRSKLLKISKI
ncbi:MAG: alpha-galactosidase [Fusobacteriaceae bacterium]